MSLATLPTWLGAAWLLPLVSFAILCFASTASQGFRVRPAPWKSRLAGLIAILAIGASFAISLFALVKVWIPNYPPHETWAAFASIARHGEWYRVATFGDIAFDISYYIDSLTLAMFCLVTFISLCVHLYSFGYLKDELHEVVDNEAPRIAGQSLRRPGRFDRFYMLLSLFSFSMLGIVIAGNLAMVFVFWELVGVCSYFLIGFYWERPSATTAASKAFIFNRVGDAGMLVGLMALLASCGTLSFGSTFDRYDAARPGLFDLVQSPAFDSNDPSTPPIASVAGVRSSTGQPPLSARTLLFIAGLGIFCGCIGKSAQAPLFAWLPDAMAGPTPVSALVHSATMVAAGVFLVGRCYPLLLPETLIVIAYVGALTLLWAGALALLSNDIKRVLAYSTVSQLGLMMLALGIGGYIAGLMHLLMHAFFKCLLFLGAGCVIHATHTNDIAKLGSLARKMPWTAAMMLIAALAMIGVGFPFEIAGKHIGLSGYYSKDAIVEQAIIFRGQHAAHGWLLDIVLVGACLTALYIFRLWFMVFLGTARDADRIAHAHESPWSMRTPMLALAALAICAGGSIPLASFTSELPDDAKSGRVSIESLIVQSMPRRVELDPQLLEGTTSHEDPSQTLLLSEQPLHAYDSHERSMAGWLAFASGTTGLALAAILYLFLPTLGAKLDQGLRPVAPLLNFTDMISAGLAKAAERLSPIWSAVIDRGLINGTLDGAARLTWRLGNTLHEVQTGRLRQYVALLVVGLIGLFAIVSYAWSRGVSP